MQELYELLELADEKMKMNDNVDSNLINSIKQKISSNGYIGLAQINPAVGNIEYNATRLTICRIT